MRTKEQEELAKKQTMDRIELNKINMRTKEQEVSARLKRMYTHRPFANHKAEYNEASFTPEGVEENKCDGIKIYKNRYKIEKWKKGKYCIEGVFHLKETEGYLWWKKEYNTYIWETLNGCGGRYDRKRTWYNIIYNTRYYKTIEEAEKAIESFH